MIKLKNFSLFSKHKFNYFFFGIELLICIGCLALFAEGLDCYECKYIEGGATGSSDDCLDPVKNKMKAKTCYVYIPPPPIPPTFTPRKVYCLKQTSGYGKIGTPTKLFRTCTDSEVEGILPGVELCFKSNDDTLGKMSSDSDDAIPKEFSETLKAAKLASKEISSTRCYCDSNKCNGQPGKDTKDGSANSENLHVFSSKLIFLVSLPLRYFLNKM